MKKHLITYDLHTPGKDYASLISAIKSYADWTEICKSCWAIRTDETDNQIRDKRMTHIDANDWLFVCVFDGWSSYGLPKKASNWLHA